jgi:PPK2 family polyphosphate:nucleotide phosphotransferase
MKWNKYKVKPGTKPKLSKFDTHPGAPADKDGIKKLLATYVDKISDLQYKLFAENRQSLLIILQGMDSSGKDGTIKKIMNGVNPQGVKIWSFKHPSELELEHDFLWRHAQKLPEHGEITIFNRSHYENVLISRVHPKIVLAERLPGVDATNKIDKKFWKKRYGQITNFEENIIVNGTQILKFFLHLSKDEQRKRFLARIDEKEKHWKFSSADITERGYWDEYQHAYELAFKHTSTRHAPWYIIPADDKLYAHLVIAKIILEKLREMAPSFPKMDKKEEDLLASAKEELMRG